MKTLQFIILLVIISASLKAQRGLEAGAIIQPQVYTQIHCETPTDKAMKIPYSFAIGVDLGYNFTDRIGLRTGLLYTPIGERYNDLSNDPEQRVDLNLNYIQAPLYFKYNSNIDNQFSFLMLVGGYIGYLNEALQTIESEDPVAVLSEYKRIMPGAAVGLGTQINLERGGNINIMWRSSVSLDIVQLGGPSSRNFTSGLQISYHYFLIGG